MAIESRDSVVYNASAAERGMDIDALPFLTTKLYRPPVTLHLEQRDRLVERLELNLRRPLTLILAPAGYGKTTLASMWLESSDCASAWLSVDEGDNDLHTFVRYLLAAVSGAFSSLELKTQSLLDAPTLPPMPVLARYILNDLDQIREPFILALDDVHLIREQAVFELVSQLLRHPPRALHLVLIGRHTPALPIASLRASGQVTEVRASDLRFTPHETAGLLGRMLGREIDAAVAEEWTEQTEGWVTALRLAGLSLRHRGRPDDLRANIHRDSRYLRDYLLAEVVAQLPAAHQAWLLKTAVLDRFCAPLCEAVCQAGADCAETGIDGESFIEWLQCENLFVVPLDDQHEWFRFHHLFQELLLGILEVRYRADEVDALRLAACHWCAENGLLDEALQYALAAGDVPGAVKLVEQHRYSLMNGEQWNRLDHWIRMLPEDAVAQSPLLASAKAFLALHRGRDREISVCQQQAVRLLTTLPLKAAVRQTADAEFGVIQAMVDVAVGQPGRAISRARKSLRLLPPDALHIRSLALFEQATGLQMQGDLGQGIAILREAHEERVWPVGLRATLKHYSSIIYFLTGDLIGALRSARECLQTAEQFRLQSSASFSRCFLGIVHYLRNEFALAEPYLLSMLKDRVVSVPSYLANGVFVLALIHISRGRLAEAEQVLELLIAQLSGAENSFAQASTEAFRVELALRQGKVAEARRLSTSVEFDLRPPLWFFYVPQLTHIKLLLAEGTARSLKEACNQLDALDGKMRSLRRNTVLIEVLALQSLVYDALNDEPVAIDKLRGALALGEPGGFIRTFVDLGAPMAELLLRSKELDAGPGFSGYADRYVDQILLAFPNETARTAQNKVAPKSGYLVPSPALVEPLTERELQTLRLLATDLSTEEIAAELFVVNATIHTYSKRIYGKLEAHSRFEAVQRAMELGLL